MRTPVYRIENDDDPMDFDYPMAATFEQMADGLMFDEERAYIERMPRGESIVIGGGAAVQFSVTRIR